MHASWLVLAGHGVWYARAAGAAQKRADIEYVLLAGSSVSYVNGVLFCVCDRVCGTSMIFKGKMAV